MGLKKSKPHRREYDEGPTVKSTGGEIREYSPIHSDSVNCVEAFSTGVCLSGSADKSVVLFDWKSGQVVQRWCGHERGVTKVVHGGKTIYSASRDKTIRVWKVGKNDGMPMQVLDGHSMVVTAIDLNQDHSSLFSGSRDNSVKLWDTNTGVCIREKAITRNLVTYVKWMPGTHEVVQSGEDKMLRIWDSRNMEPAVTFPMKQYFQTCIDCSADGKYILTCNNGFNSRGCEATLWDARERKELFHYTGHFQTASACLFLPILEKVSSRNLIMTSSHDMTIKVWSRDSQECLLTEEFSGAGPLSGLAAWDDGSVCVSTFNQGIYGLLLENINGALQLTRKSHF